MSISGRLENIEPNMIDVTTWDWHLHHTEPDMVESGVNAKVILHVGAAKIPVLWALNDKQTQMYNALREDILTAALADFKASLEGAV